MTKWTPDAIRALGPATGLPTLAAILECGRVAVRSVLDVLIYDAGASE